MLAWIGGGAVAAGVLAWTVSEAVAALSAGFGSAKLVVTVPVFVNVPAVEVENTIEIGTRAPGARAIEQDTS